MGVLGAGGLALANTLAVTAEVLVLMVILRKRWGSVEGRLIGRTLLRAGLASAVMGLVTRGVSGSRRCDAGWAICRWSAGRAAGSTGLRDRWPATGSA